MTAEIFHYSQTILPCDETCCGGETCSLQVDVIADGVQLHSKVHPPSSGVEFAASKGSSVTITVTPQLSGGRPSESVTREFVAGAELPPEGIFGSLEIDKLVSLED